MNPESQLPADALAAIHENRKIEAIKLLRDHGNLGLKEAKEIVDSYAPEHPHLIASRQPKLETSLSRLVILGILLAALYALYRFFS